MTAARLACAVTLAALLSVPGTAWSQAAGGGLPPTIPLFPLQDVVLFPDMSRPLHIFEQRYRDMVTDAVQGDGLIGMVLLRPGYEADYEGNPPIFEVGCAGEIVQAEELDDGRWSCGCDFFSHNGACAHTMALELLLQGMLPAPEASPFPETIPA